MKPTKITRPTFPRGYVDNAVSFLTWDWVAEQLAESKNYWICSVRPPTPSAPGGRPHVIPRWAVFIDGKIYYDGSLETRHSRNIEWNPNVSVHLESGTEAIMLEGTSRTAERPSPELGRSLSQEYKKKYTELGYAPEPNSWNEGGLFVFTPRQSIAWTKFNENPTKFIFGDIAHFFTLTFWKDLESIKAFAGVDEETAKYYPEDQDFLLEIEPKVLHYDVVGHS